MNLSKYFSVLCHLFIATIYVLLIIVFFTMNAKAENLGTYGEVYPILETDFIDLIHVRLNTLQKTGEWQTIQNRAGEKARTYRDRPTSVVGITKSKVSISRQYDPSIVLDHDVIASNSGKVIARTGTRINPLVYRSLSNTLIFYDSDDKDQVKWVLAKDKALKGKTKLILINGSVINQEKRFNKPIYFDQSGKLVARFGIQHVPAIVTQEGLYLRIKEVAI